jgi:hypothetical protein
VTRANTVVCGLAEAGGDLAVVAGDDLDRDAEAGQALERSGHVRLRRVGEAEEAIQPEVALVRVAEPVERYRAAGDGDDALARAEQSPEDVLRSGSHACAAGEHSLRGTPGDE